MKTWKCVVLGALLAMGVACGGESSAPADVGTADGGTQSGDVTAPVLDLVDAMLAKDGATPPVADSAASDLSELPSLADLLPPKPDPLVSGSDADVADLPSPLSAVTIGSQTWSADNLAIATPGSKCYGDDPKNCEIYGRLYSFEAAKTACPSGWRLPSDDEWKVLEETLGMPPSDLDKLGFSELRGTDQGSELKPGGSSGLALPMSGYATSGGYFSLTDKTYLWTSTVLPNGQVIRRRIESESPLVYRFSNPPEDFWISVRCIKE